MTPDADPLLSAAAIAAVDSTGQLADVLGSARASARRAVARGVRRDQRRSTARRDGGRGDGRLGDRRRAGARGARATGCRGRCRSRAGTRCRRGRRRTWRCCARSYSGETEETLAIYEAAGAVGAQRIVCTTGGRLAASARADGVPVIPLPGGFQPRAAVGYALVVRARGRGAGRGRGAAAHRDRCRRRPRRAADRRVGPRRAGGLAGQGAGAAAARDGACRSRGRADRADRVSLEDAVQRERQAARVRRRAARARSQRDRRLGAARPGSAASAPCSWTTAICIPASGSGSRLTAELIGDHAATIERVETIGETAVERLVSLVLLGDLVTIYSAVLAGRDPAQIDVLHALKKRAGRLERCCSQRRPPEP